MSLVPYPRSKQICNFFKTVSPGQDSQKTGEGPGAQWLFHSQVTLQFLLLKPHLAIFWSLMPLVPYPRTVSRSLGTHSFAKRCWNSYQTIEWRYRVIQFICQKPVCECFFQTRTFVPLGVGAAESGPRLINDDQGRLTGRKTCRITLKFRKSEQRRIRMGSFLINLTGSCPKKYEVDKVQYYELVN